MRKTRKTAQLLRLLRIFAAIRVCSISVLLQYDPVVEASAGLVGVFG